MGLGRYWRIFGLMQADRPVGFGGISYIPSGSIINYLVNVEHEDDAREITRAIRFVRAIDDEFISLQREKQEAPDKGE